MIVERRFEPALRACPVLDDCPQSRITSPFSGPSFVLALAGIRWRVVQIKAIEKNDLIPL